VAVVVLLLAAAVISLSVLARQNVLVNTAQVLIAMPIGAVGTAQDVVDLDSVRDDLADVVHRVLEPTPCRSVAQPAPVRRCGEVRGQRRAALWWKIRLTRRLWATMGYRILHDGPNPPR
jgi:hypothetical protein